MPVGYTGWALIVTLSVPVLAKNPAGYDSVIVPPAAMDPPAEVVNEKMAEAPVLPATRSDGLAMKNEVLVTEVLGAGAAETWPANVVAGAAGVEAGAWPANVVAGAAGKVVGR